MRKLIKITITRKGLWCNSAIKVTSQVGGRRPVRYYFFICLCLLPYRELQRKVSHLWEMSKWVNQNPLMMSCVLRLSLCDFKILGLLEISFLIWYRCKLE